MRKRKINIIEIANESGFSIASVSRVVNGKSGVSEKNRKKINALLRKYNYVPDSHLSRERKIAILSGGEIIGDYVNPVFHGISKYCHENNITYAVIAKSQNSKLSLTEQIRDQQCSALIVILPFRFRRELDELVDLEMPVILIDDVVYKNGIGFVSHDSYSGSREAIRYLLELGHRNIGYIRQPLHTGNHLRRFKAYENTMNEFGIEIKPQWLKSIPDVAYPWKGSYDTMMALMKQAPELTAIMTSNDNIAIGAIKAIIDSGRKVPEDISVIGFDNYPHVEFLNPSLTTVSHPMIDAGYMAAKEIELVLKEPGRRQLPQEILPTKLFVRGSTCAPRKNN